MPFAKPNPARTGLEYAARSYRLAAKGAAGELGRAEEDHRTGVADRLRGRLLRLELCVDELGARLSPRPVLPESVRFAS